MHVFTYILGNQYQACMTLKKYLKLFSSRNFQCSIRRILLDATSALPSWILSHKLVICRFKFLKFKPLAKSCKIKFIASHFKTVSCVVDEIYNLFNIYVQTRVLGILNEISNTGYTETVMFKFWNCWTKDDISSYGFDPQICHSNVLHKSTIYSLWTANYIANEW